MKIAKITDPCQPVGTQMSFWQPECPDGWELVREKPDDEMPSGAKESVVVTCAKVQS